MWLGLVLLGAASPGQCACKGTEVVKTIVHSYFVRPDWQCVSSGGGEVDCACPCDHVTGTQLPVPPPNGTAVTQEVECSAPSHIVLGPLVIGGRGVFFPLQRVVLTTSTCSSGAYTARVNSSALSGDAIVGVDLPPLAAATYNLCVGTPAGGLTDYPLTRVTCRPPLTIRVTNRRARLVRAGGETITIVGSGFSTRGVLSVTFNGIASIGDASILGDGTLTALTPNLGGGPALGTVPITVTLNDGVSATVRHQLAPSSTVAWSISSAAGPTVSGAMRAYSVGGIDVDGNGHIDLVVGTDAGVFVAQGNSTGAFPAWTQWSTRICFQVAVADTDDDGLGDVVCGTPDGSPAFLLHSTGPTSPMEVVLSTGVSTPAVVMLADVIGDLYPDLVVGTQGNLATVVVMQGSSSGFGLASTILTAIPGGNITALHTLDLNNDGYDDIVASATWGEVVVMYSTNGTGFAVPDIMVSDTLLRPGGFSLSDVDGDSTSDIFVPQGVVADMYLSTSPTTWTKFRNFTSFTGPDPILEAAMSDINVDGNDDLLLSNSGGITYYMGLGGGTFSSVQMGFLPYVGGFIGTFDVNGDFYPDVITPGCDSAAKVCVAVGHL